ncbi:MAG: hypothetical protein JNM27_18020 [Leptospirales bacterium]|nr:hypothetical protein [Leptospirales bacterium]
MNRSLIVALSAIAGVILLAVIAYLVVERKDSRPGGPDVAGPDRQFKDMYPDAPNPMDDPELAEQIKNLWPDVSKPKPDRDAVRREWADFVKKYPDNIYIPDEFKSPLSESQAEERRKTLDTVASVETKFANMRAAAKSSQPGQDGPPAPGQPTATPQEQTVYFDYKIQELQSRIQLVEYMLANGEPDAEQKTSAQKELQQWGKDLENYKKLKSSIPGT